MSGKLNMKSIIAIAAVTILTAIAITGTVVFLRDKGTSEATEIASENGVNGSGTETINVQENGVKETQEQNGENNGVLTTEGITNNNENNINPIIEINKTIQEHNKMQIYKQTITQIYQLIVIVHQEQIMQIIHKQIMHKEIQHKEIHNKTICKDNKREIKTAIIKETTIHKELTI